MTIWLIRIAGIITLALITMELWRIQRLISSERFTAILRKWAYAFLIFTVLRIIGGILDWYAGLATPWFSAASSFAMNGYIFWHLYGQRKILEYLPPDSITGRRKVSEKMEDVLLEMKGREQELSRGIFFWR